MGTGLKKWRPPKLKDDIINHKKPESQCEGAREQGIAPISALSRRGNLVDEEGRGVGGEDGLLWSNRIKIGKDLKKKEITHLRIEMQLKDA